MKPSVSNWIQYVWDHKSKVFLQYGTFFIVGLFGLATNLFLARQIGPAEFGYFSVLFNVAIFLVIIIDFGQKTKIRRDYAFASVNNTQKLSKNKSFYVSLFLLCSILITVYLLADVHIFRSKYDAYSSVIFAFGLALTGFISGKFQGAGHFFYDGAWQLICKVSVLIVLGVALVRFDMSAGAIAFSWGCVIILLTLPLLLRELINRKTPQELQKQKTSKKNALIFLFLIELGTFAYLRADILIMHHLEIDARSIGSYYLAHKFFEIGIFFVTPFSLLLFRFFVTDVGTLTEANLRDKRRLFLWSSGVGAAFGLLGWFFWSNAWMYIAGSEYLNFSTLLGLLSISFIFLFPNALIGQWLIANGKEQYLFMAVTMVAILSVVLNFIFIEFFGVFGGAVVKIISECVLLISSVVIFKICTQKSALSG